MTASQVASAERMQCMEVWGGNSPVDRDIATAGLQVWLHSRPYEQAEKGGDVYYVSSCASGRITRLLLADVSGHGDCFMQKVGGVDRFKEIMTWLPTWDDARQILRLLQVPDAAIQHELVATEAFERGIELQVLYQLIATELERTMPPSRDSSKAVAVQ